MVNLLPPGFLANALREDARSGFAASPKSLQSKWAYDAHGSALYEKIMKLPEFYLARAEQAILRDAGHAIAARTAARTLIDLASGPSDKTRLLLDALRASGTLESYVGVNLSETALETAEDVFARKYPGLAIRMVVADVEEHLGLPGYPASEPRLVAFLGSAIGHMTPSRRQAFFGRVRARLRLGDAFLLGADLIKDPEVLVAAYDDGAGLMAAFDKNLLAVLNDRLGADFDLDAFDHVAVWVPETEWIETRLRSVVAQEVHVPGAGLTVHFAAGEEMRTEVAAKFRQGALTRELEAAGLAVRAWWTDPADQFAVVLSVPV